LRDPHAGEISVGVNIECEPAFGDDCTGVPTIAL
jgi:hypothetical protein